MKRAFGPLLAGGIVLLGTVVVVRAPSATVATAGIRALGTLLTVVFGLFSALWWRQSAALADEMVAGHSDSARIQRQSNLLNGAAATATGLALIGSVFSSLTWDSAEAWLAGSAFLLLLTLSGGEIRSAALLSFRRRRNPRSVLSFAVLVLGTLLYLAKWLLE